MFSLENIHYSPVVHFLAHLTTQPSVSVGIGIFIFPKVCVIPPRENGIQVNWHIDIKKKKSPEICLKDRGPLFNVIGR